MSLKNISFKNFKIKTKLKSDKIKLIFIKIVKENNEIIKSLKKDYKNSFSKSLTKKFNKYKYFNIIGMGGSSLGSKAIYYFLRHKIKKQITFFDNLVAINKSNKKTKFNLIISKSGNTLETIVNSNILIKKNDKNIFLIENKDSYLNSLANKLKADIVSHNNFIGGRFSVLSEVGMLPAELFGLKSENFRQLNSLVKNKSFFDSIVKNVASTIEIIKKKKHNSIILNYDPQSESLFLWYQQLIAESLGKNHHGILPVVSNMPKDNHSTMQLYLDGFQKNFYTFFFVKEKNSSKIKNNTILETKSFLKNKNLNDIIYAQKKATENVFRKKNIPFRSFELKQRDENTLGKLFTFFILETILLAKALKINPYDQPAVELIKQETKKKLY